jgi:hypothetical protein
MLYFALVSTTSRRANDDERGRVDGEMEHDSRHARSFGYSGNIEDDEPSRTQCQKQRGDADVNVILCACSVAFRINRLRRPFENVDDAGGAASGLEIFATKAQVEKYRAFAAH